MPSLSWPTYQCRPYAMPAGAACSPPDHQHRRLQHHRTARGPEIEHDPHRDPPGCSPSLTSRRQQLVDARSATDGREHPTPLPLDEGIDCGEQPRQRVRLLVDSGYRVGDGADNPVHGLGVTNLERGTKANPVDGDHSQSIAVAHVGDLLARQLDEEPMFLSLPVCLCDGWQQGPASGLHQVRGSLEYPRPATSEAAARAGEASPGDLSTEGVKGSPRPRKNVRLDRIPVDDAGVDRRGRSRDLDAIRCDMLYKYDLDARCHLTPPFLDTALRHCVHRHTAPLWSTITDHCHPTEAAHRCDPARPVSGTTPSLPDGQPPAAGCQALGPSPQQVSLSAGASSAAAAPGTRPGRTDRDGRACNLLVALSDVRQVSHECTGPRDPATGLVNTRCQLTTPAPVWVSA